MLFVVVYVTQVSWIFNWLDINVYFVGDNYNPWVTGAHWNAKKCDGLLLRGVNIWLVLPLQTFYFTRSRREGKLNSGYHIASLPISKALKGFALYKVSEFGLKSRRVLSEKLATCSWLSLSVITSDKANILWFAWNENWNGQARNMCVALYLNGLRYLFIGFCHRFKPSITW